jgi:hypothetical protein
LPAAFHPQHPAKSTACYSATSTPFYPSFTQSTLQTSHIAPAILGPSWFASALLPAAFHPQHPAKSTACYPATSTPIHPSFTQPTLQTNQVAPAILGPSTFATNLLSAPAHPQHPTFPIDVVSTILGPSTSDPISTPALVHPQPPASPIDVALNTLSPPTSDPCLLPAIVHPQRPAKPRKFWVKFDVGALLRLQKGPMVIARIKKGCSSTKNMFAQSTNTHREPLWRPPDALLAKEPHRFLPLIGPLYTCSLLLYRSQAVHRLIYLLISDCYVGNDAGCSRSLSLTDICNY